MTRKLEIIQTNFYKCWQGLETAVTLRPKSFHQRLMELMGSPSEQNIIFINYGSKNVDNSYTQEVNY